MCEAGGSDLLSDVRNYEPFYVEEHVDSSDFETPLPLFEPKKKKPKKRQQVDDNAVLRHADVYYQKIDKPEIEDKRKERKPWKGQNKDKNKSDLQEGLEQLRSIMVGYGDVKGTPSKWSLIKHKVVSISNMIGRKCGKIEKDKEEETEIKHDKICDIFCARCVQRQSRKVRRKKQPVYITEGSLQVPIRIGATKILQVPLDYNAMNGHSFNTLDSSSGSHIHTKDIGTEMKIIKPTKDKFNQTKKPKCRVHKDSLLEHILCTLCNQKINRSSTLDKQILCNNLSVEYLDNVFHDVQSKYQPELAQDDYCVHNCSHYKGRDDTDVPKCCRFREPPPPQGMIQRITPPQQVPNITPAPPYPPLLPPPAPLKQKESKSKVECECYPDKSKQPAQQTIQTQTPSMPTYEKPGLKLYQPPRMPRQIDEYFTPPSQATTEICPGSADCQQLPYTCPYQPPQDISEYFSPPIHACQPPPVCPKPTDCMRPSCQYPHEAVREAVQNKYNSEVVCIHNPPCVLINGCLNLPPACQPEPLQVYATTNNNRSGVFRRWHSKTRTNEQGIQHRMSLISEQQCQTSVYRADKLMQSSCNHEPRCEIVRRCTKVELPVQDSCIHIPKCPELTEKDYIESKKTKNCECPEKNGESEVKRRHAIQLTAKEHISTQVKPKYDNSENYCVHVPVCKKLPQCCFPEAMCSSLKRPTSDQRLIASEMPISTMDYVDYPVKDDMSVQANGCQNQRCASYDRSSMFEKPVKCHKGNLHELRTIIEKPSWGLPRTSINKIITLHSRIKSPTLVKSSHEHTCININYRKEPKYLIEKREVSNSVQKARSLENTVKHLVQLTPRDEAGIQVTTNGRHLCRHQPNCVRIPKCLGSIVKDSVMPYDDIPDCNHQPYCELIPACCRKVNKEVSSVACQFPASCRIA